MRTFNEKMAGVGFRPPAGSFEKPDPRGSEYGMFHASELPSGVLVVWHGAGERTR